MSDCIYEKVAHLLGEFIVTHKPLHITHNVMSKCNVPTRYCALYNQGEEEEAFHLFIELQHERVMPDVVTFIFFEKENTKPHVVNFLGDLTVCTNLISLDGCFNFSDDLETLEKVVKLLDI